jgi:ElaA protein
MSSACDPLTWRWLRFDQLSARDLHDVLRLRQDVFVIEQACLYADIDGLDLQCLHGLGCGADGSLAAYARVVPPGLKFTEPAIGRVIVAPAWRGRSLGGVLMREAIAATRQTYPAAAIRISAQAHLQGFYRGLGFETVSDEYDEDGIAHVDMLNRA